MHHGVDFPKPIGTNVYPVQEGCVGWMDRRDPDALNQDEGLIAIFPDCDANNDPKPESVGCAWVPFGDLGNTFRFSLLLAF